MNIQFGERLNKDTIENGNEFSPKFGEDGLIPAVAQDASSGKVLMVAYMNDEALKQTLEKGEAVYYSRSRNKLWHKGETSGHTQKIIEILTDCDQDVIVLRVNQIGPGCCHVGYESCFYRKIPFGNEAKDSPLNGVPQLEHKGNQTYDPKKVY
jgi:phosphoribosyl-AMP cyclohydrolase